MTRAERVRAAVPWLVLVDLSFLFRLPSLLNANATNSDAAVCGLQAMHFLRGEGAWFLWGSGYQTSVDSFVAALYFAVLGPSALALMLSTLVDHVVVTLFAFATLSRHVDPWKACALASLLVFTAGPVHTYVLYPPREASLTIAFAAIFFLDRARDRHATRDLVLGGALASLAVFADPYPLLYLPAFFLLVVLFRSNKERATGLAAMAAGAVPYVLLRRSRGATLGQTSLTLDVVKHNWDLFKESCWPWALSTTPYAPKHWSDYGPWEAPKWFAAIQTFGAIVFILAILSGFVLFFDRSLDPKLRRLGLFGAAMLPVNVGGFLVSPMVMDHFSSRYLVAFLLTSPFAIAPLAKKLSLAKLSILAPYLVSAAVGGWVAYKPFTDGFAISTKPGAAVNEKKLEALLREHGVRYAVADYWASYRLTLLFDEDPIVVPKNPEEDRYRPYRDAWEASVNTAYIFDAYRSRESLPDFEKALAEGKTPYEPATDKLEIGEFTVFLVTRKSVGAVETKHASR